MSTVGAPIVTKSLLEVENLKICLAGTKVDVVDEVTFSVRAGEVLGLVGESGSGKTTVALAVLAHTRRGLEIAGGHVRIDGTDVLAASKAEIRRIRGHHVTYVPQDPASALNPTLKIGTQLREVFASGKNQGAPVDDVDARILEVLAETGLRDGASYLKRYPHQLSGGQQQRIGIAMAFATRPRLIVLDEPTTGLDVTTQAQVLDTVRQMCGRYNVAAICVSHDLALVAQLASRVAVMYAGRIVEQGATETVLTTPTHPYTERLLRAVPSTEKAHALEGIRGHPPRPAGRPAGCTFAPRCELAIDKCRAERPPDVAVGDAGHFARCWRASEVTHTGEPLLLTSRPVAAKESAPMLKVAGLSASYASTQVLHDISFDVQRESCLAVVGESGSGKTTLSRCIVGLHSRWSGEMSFDGTALPPVLRARDRSTLRRIQFIFQNPYTSLNPRRTIGQLVAQPLEDLFDLSRADINSRVGNILEDVSLPSNAMTRYPDELSGGERQRVAIARALVVNPDLLVCDEITSALDVSVQAVIVELLRLHQFERHLAIIFVTHNLALVRSIAQDVVVLSDGRIRESGPVDSVLDHPSDEYTIKLLEHVPTLETRHAAL